MVTLRTIRPKSRLRLGAFTLASFGVLATLLPGAATAGAGELPGAITGVHVVETTSELYANMRLELTYAVPDSAVSGDTFSLTLPDSLRSATNGFELRDTAGNLVTVATVRGRVATFTLTEFANIRNNISGTAWFDVRFNPLNTGVGDNVAMEFVTNGPTFTDSVIATGPGDVDITKLFKYQVWTSVDGTEDSVSPAGALTWGIHSAQTPADAPKSTVTLVDTPRDGSTIDCASVKVHEATTQNNRNELGNVTDIPATRTTLTCEPTEARLVVTGVGPSSWVRMSGTSSVTDSKLKTFSNTATSTVNGVTTAITAFTPRGSAGGNGQGVTPLAKPTTTTPANPASQVKSASTANTSTGTRASSNAGGAGSVSSSAGSNLAATGQSTMSTIVLALILIGAGALATFGTVSGPQPVKAPTSRRRN